MSYFNGSSFLSYSTLSEKLQFIVNNPDIVNNMTQRRYGSGRPLSLTIALSDASDILPDGKSKRALDYLARHPSAEFHFGGKDAVRPALLEAIKALDRAA